MSNVYDGRTREAALRQRQFCDPLSAKIISELVEYLDRWLAAEQQQTITALTLKIGSLEAANAELRSRLQEAEKGLQVWRAQLLDAWANDHRATMTALLEGGPANSEGLGGE